MDVLAVGPVEMVKFVDVASAVQRGEPFWLRVSWMKHDPRPIFKSVTLMVDASGVQGRKNSMCSVCTSG
jgi:hypothetical protein